MASQQSCAYYSGEIIVELENIRRYAKRNNAEVVDNHLTLLEKQYDNIALHCGILEATQEKPLLQEMRTFLTNKQLDKVGMNARYLEKKVLKHLAKNVNEGNDPLDLIPARVIDSFGI